MSVCVFVVVVIQTVSLFESLLQKIMYVYFSGRKNFVYLQRLGTALCAVHDLGTCSGKCSGI